MKINVIDTGFFKLDGGAMFGVVPKSLWNKHNSADDKNRCTWAMRCLLIEDGDHLVLIDTGLGNKQDAKFFGHYDLHGDATLKSSIEIAGYAITDVTDVVLTHLHFDHVGGAVVYNADRSVLSPAFPNATYWSNAAHWNWALNPNPREKASFFKENILPLQEAGVLRFVEDGRSPFANIDFLVVNGHTEQMLLPLIRHNQATMLYAADLLPSSYHIPLAWVMSYDVRPLVSMQEKADILKKAVDEQYIILFEHDPVFEAGVVEQTEKGIIIRERGDLRNFISG